MELKTDKVTEALRFKETLTSLIIGSLPDEEQLQIKSIVAFSMLAECAGLAHEKGNIFTDNKGNRFIHTKYGFQPVEIFNKALVVKEHIMANKKLKEEKQQSDHDTAKYKHYSELLLSALKEKQAANDLLAQEKEALRQELKKTDDLKQLLLINEQIRVNLLTKNIHLYKSNENLTEQKKNYKRTIEELSQHIDHLKTRANNFTMSENHQKLSSVLHGMQTIVNNPSMSAPNKVGQISNYLKRLVNG